jgi:MarR family transcriptional regulator, 2-MHQ and catechol-resistance regulon repressor
MAATDRTPATESCAYVVGDDGLSRWSDTHAQAWVGFLETHRRITRALDGALEARHALNMSALELLGRLAAAPERRMRLSALAADCGLSLSRVSRIVDTLERRGLVARHRLEHDRRAAAVTITAHGEELVQRLFPEHAERVAAAFSPLDDAEKRTLAELCRKLAA